MCIDTTVQEKNITFPTDARQYRKIHGHLLKMAKKENIGLTRAYEIVTTPQSVSINRRKNCSSK